jgi:hypothetical protein
VDDEKEKDDREQGKRARSRPPLPTAVPNSSTGGDDGIERIGWIRKQRTAAAMQY